MTRSFDIKYMSFYRFAKLQFDTTSNNIYFKAKHAENIKADSILCLPELYFSPSTSDQLKDYLKLVSSAAPNTPLLYYHIPSLTNVNGKLIITVITILSITRPKLKNYTRKYVYNDYMQMSRWKLTTLRCSIVTRSKHHVNIISIVLFI